MHISNRKTYSIVADAGYISGINTRIALICGAPNAHT